MGPTSPTFASWTADTLFKERHRPAVCSCWHIELFFQWLKKIGQADRLLYGSQDGRSSSLGEDAAEQGWA